MAKWYTNKAIKMLKGVIKEKGYKPSQKMWYQTIGDAKHRARRSDHNPADNSNPPGAVRAADVFLEMDDLRAFVEVLRLGRYKWIKYVIFDGKMFSSYTKGKYGPFEWRPYKHAKTMPHDKHCHVSVTRDSDHMSDRGMDLFPKREAALSDVPGKSPGYDQPLAKPSERRVLESILAHPKQAWGNLHETTKAVQKLVGTDADGIVGPKTRRAIAEYFEWEKK